MRVNLNQPPNELAKDLFAFVYDTAKADEFHAITSAQRERWQFLAAAIQSLGDQIPGVWHCPKCRFQQHKSVMSLATGEISADNSPFNVYCPNDGALMHPLTYQLAYEQLSAAFQTQVLRAVSAEERLKS